MMPARRTLMRSLVAGMLTAGVLGGCTAPPGRFPRGKRSEAPAPSGAPLVEPTQPLRLASIGTEIGPLARFEPQIALAIEEAVHDVDFHGGVFGQDLRPAPRHVMVDEDEDLGAWVARMAAEGVTAVVCSIDDASLLRVLPALVDARIAVISPTSSSSRLRSRADDAGLLVRLSPSTGTLAQLYAQDAITMGDVEEGPRPGTVGFLGPRTEEADALLADLHAALEPLGGHVVTEHRHAPGRIGEVTEVAGEIIAREPALLVVASGVEVGPLLGRLHTAGLDEHGRRGRTMTVYLGPEATADYSTADLPEGSLHTVHGIQPGAELGTEQISKVLGRAPELYDAVSARAANFGYVQQAYDAVVLAALGAQLALSNDGTAIAHGVGQVLRGEVACEGVDACLQALHESFDADRSGSITYHPWTGELRLDGNDPVAGKLRRYAFDEAHGVRTTEVIGFPRS